jgi:AraC-like DNA-binding protein
MKPRLKYRRWETAKALHQVQLLSCDYAEFDTWEASDLQAPYWRLYWHDAPGAWIDIGEGRRALRVGSPVLIAPHTHFACGNDRPFGQLFLHFRLEPGLSENTGRVFWLRSDAALSRVARTLRKGLLAEGSGLQLSFSAQEFLALALQQVPEADWAVPAADARVSAAIRSIQSAYPARLSLQALSREASLHPGSFARLFREGTGHTPLQYLNNLRMEEACVLLHRTELSIDEVAAKLGFADRLYFTRLFSARLGISPAKYRRLVNTDNRLRR